MLTYNKSLALSAFAWPITRKSLNTSVHLAKSQSKASNAPCTCAAKTVWSAFAARTRMAKLCIVRYPRRLKPPLNSPPSAEDGQTA